MLLVLVQQLVYQGRWVAAGLPAPTIEQHIGGRGLDL
jgi:hypothetical protein